MRGNPKRFTQNAHLHIRMYKINRQKAENKSGKMHYIYIEKQTTLVKTMEKRKF